MFQISFLSLLFPAALSPAMNPNTGDPNAGIFGIIVALLIVSALLLVIFAINNSKKKKKRRKK